MRDLITHVPTGIVLDLSDPDYGHPHGREIVDSLYGHLSRSNPELVCAKHGSPLYLQGRASQKHGRRLFGIHFNGEESHRWHSGMSDEHKRQTDYIVRAAESAGFTFKTEVSLGTRVRPDAVIYGQRDIAIEVQRSHLTKAAAVGRTTKAVNGGMATSVWFSDRDPAKPPSWFWAVPSVGMNKLPWDVLPPMGAATATTGLRKVYALKCRFPNFSRCPRGGRPCGKHHAEIEPWRGMSVDDVAAQMPAGLVVPIMFLGKQIILVSPESKALYEELTGRHSELKLHPAVGQPRASGDEDGRVECVSEATGPSITCCGDHQPGERGGPLTLACQLCPQSPTYWRRRERLRGAGPTVQSINRLVRG